MSRPYHNRVEKSLLHYSRISMIQNRFERENVSLMRDLFSEIQLKTIRKKFFRWLIRELIEDHEDPNFAR